MPTDPAMTAADGPGRAGTANTEPTLTEVLRQYADAGFDADAFAAEGGALLCGTCQSRLEPSTVEVHSIRRMEGQSDPADMLGVIAVICPVCGSHATAVLKFGPDASPDENAIWQGTNDARSSDILPAGAPPAENDPAMEATMEPSKPR